MQVDHEGMDVASGFVPVGMTVRLRAFPALMVVLVVLVVYVMVLMPYRRVPVRQFLRIVGGPDNNGQHRRCQRYEREHSKRDVEPEPLSDQARERISDQPAGM